MASLGEKKIDRPVGFDKDAVLNAAILLFWERGFEGTSMAALTEAMSLSPSSIYAAFGDKQSLFRLAAQRYGAVPAQYAVRALEQPTLAAVVRALFRNTVDFLITGNNPSGCMTLTGALACSVDANPAKQLMTEMRCQNEAVIKARLQEAKRAGELAKDVSVDD